MEADELIAERYRLASLIGRGAMGVVWLAQDERLDREVAVKQLLIADSPDPALGDTTAEQATQRAMREARIVARLRHPNTIAVHDVVEHDGRPCLVMEYLRSKNLDAVLLARGCLPPREAAAIGAQLAAALAETHAAGIVHRDIKPENILITEDGTAKITDFGVARGAGFGTVTTTGILAGTPVYLAPEVARGEDASPPSDVFSLGATLYTAVEGQPPFGLTGNPISQLLEAATRHITPPQQAGPLTDLLMWLLRRDPTERPTMRTAHEALAAVAAGQPYPVPPPHVLPSTRQDPTPRQTSRRAVVASVAAAVVLAAGVVLFGVLKREPVDVGTPPPTSAPPVTAPTCLVSYEIVQSWPGGYKALVTIRNNGDVTLNGWTVRWTQPAGQRVDDLWDGTLTQTATDVAVTNTEWNATVAAGDSTTFGFIVSTPEPDRPLPEPSCKGA